MIFKFCSLQNEVGVVALHSGGGGRREEEEERV